MQNFHNIKADVQADQICKAERTDRMIHTELHHCIDCLSIDEGEGLIQIIGAVDADGDECDTQFPGGGLCRHAPLVMMIAGQEVAESVQQVTQYYPAPPFFAPTPDLSGCPLDPA